MMREPPPRPETMVTNRPAQPSRNHRRRNHRNHAATIEQPPRNHAATTLRTPRATTATSPYRGLVRLRLQIGGKDVSTTSARRRWQNIPPGRPGATNSVCVGQARFRQACQSVAASLSFGVRVESAFDPSPPPSLQAAAKPDARGKTRVFSWAGARRASFQTGLRIRPW